MTTSVREAIARMPEKYRLELFRALGYDHPSGTSIGAEEIIDLVTERIKPL